VALPKLLWDFLLTLLLLHCLGLTVANCPVSCVTL